MHKVDFPYLQHFVSTFELIKKFLDENLSMCSWGKHFSLNQQRRPNFPFHRPQSTRKHFRAASFPIFLLLVIATVIFHIIFAHSIKSLKSLYSWSFPHAGFSLMKISWCARPIGIEMCCDWMKFNPRQTHPRALLNPSVSNFGLLQFIVHPEFSDIARFLTLLPRD